MTTTSAPHALDETGTKTAQHAQSARTKITSEPAQHVPTGAENLRYARRKIESETMLHGKIKITITTATATARQEPIARRGLKRPKQWRAAQGALHRKKTGQCAARGALDQKGAAQSAPGARRKIRSCCVVRRAKEQSAAASAQGQ